jgi:hypothetical protein
VNVVSYFIGFSLLAGALFGLYRLPYSKFLFHQLRRYSWPSVEATVSKAGTISVVFDYSVQWHSVFQLSYIANGKPTFSYYGLRSTDCEPAEAQSLQSAWDGAKVILRYNPRRAEEFVLDENYTGGYSVVYMPEFSGSSLDESSNLLSLPKNINSQEPS